MGRVMAKLISAQTETARALIRRLRMAGGGDASPSPQELLGLAEAIQGDQALYRELAENLQEVVWLGTPDWQHVLYVNPAYEHLWGRSVQSLYDQPLSWLEGVSEEDRERVRADIDRKAADGIADPDFLEYRVVRPDGSVRWVMARVFPIRDEEGRTWRAAGLAVDVTARHAAEEQAQRSERDFRTLARNLPCVVYRVHLADGNTMQFFNDALEGLTGFSERDLTVGEVCSIDPLILAEDRPGVVETVSRAVAAGRSFEVNYRIQRADGEVRHFSERGQPVQDEEGRPLFIDGVIFDVTAHARAEEALRLARDELEDRVEERTAELSHRAQQLARLTSELTLAEQRERQRLAQLLHDHLQQLLVGAKLGLNVLAGHSDEGSLPVVRQIEELVAQALSASRDLTVELSPPILHEAGLGAGLDWLVRRMRSHHGLSVDLRVEEGTEPDREDIAIVLFEAVRELLLNVVKHAGVTVARVAVRRHEDDRVEAVVSDRGIGFDPEEVARRPLPVAGGFGLFSLRERLSLLGGDVQIESTPGDGTRVTLTAPLRETPDDRDPPDQGDVTDGSSSRQADARRGAVHQREHAVRVLLVDDHVVMRQGLCLLLEEHDDIDVVGEASDGREGIESARRLRPAVVLMDLSMPGMNGIDATRAIRTEMPDIQVIGLSMFEEQERAEAMLAAGAAAYLTKTGDPATLVATILRVGGRDPSREDPGSSREE